MERATISEVKNRLSTYIKKVMAGGSVLILDRDRPVARLERVDWEIHPDDRLTRLQRAGLLKRSAGPVPMELLRSDGLAAKRSVLKALLEERRESR